MPRAPQSDGPWPHVAIRMPQPMLDMVLAEATRTGETKADIIRRAVMAFFDRYGVAPKGDR